MTKIFSFKKEQEPFSYPSSCNHSFRKTDKSDGFPELEHGGYAMSLEKFEFR